MLSSSSNRTPLRVLVGITGASGIIYGIRLVEIMSQIGVLEAVIYSSMAERIAIIEHGKSLAKILSDLNIINYKAEDIEAPYASSSRAPDAMVIIPCSTKTLASIANGFSDNLLTRAALSMLRLKRKLVLVIRETPLGPIELENMLKVSRGGAVILPASPAFYHKPSNIDDMINFIVGKVLDVLGIKHNLYRRWRYQANDTDSI